MCPSSLWRTGGTASELGAAGATASVIAADESTSGAGSGASVIGVAGIVTSAFCSGSASLAGVPIDSILNATLCPASIVLMKSIFFGKESS